MEKIFNGFKDALNSSFTTREKIDLNIMSILGIKSSKKILKKLYPGLLKETAIYHLISIILNMSIDLSQIAEKTDHK